MRLRVSCALLVMFASFCVARPAEAGPRQRALRLLPCSLSAVAEQVGVTDVVASDGELFLGNYDGHLRRVATAGGVPQVVASTPGRWILFLAVDDESVYFNSRERETALETIYAVSRAGGEPRVLIRDVAPVFALAPDGDWLYVVSGGTWSSGRWLADGRILRARKDGSAVETLASSLRVPMGITIDGDDLYFSEFGTSSGDTSGGVRRMPKAGGTVTVLANMPGALTLVHDAQNVYAFRITATDTGSLDAIPKQGGSVVPVLSGIGFEVLQALVLDGRELYFMNLTGPRTARVESYHFDTKVRRTLADFEWGFIRIALDECGVYYSTPGAVVRADR